MRTSPLSGIANTVRDWPAALGLAVVYYIVGEVTLAVAPGFTYDGTFWPAAGLAVAVLLVGGRQLWPGVALGHLALNWHAALPLGTATLIALGATLAAIIAADLLRTLCRQLSATLQETVKLALAIAFLSATVHAAIGTSALWLTLEWSATDWYAAWSVWWLNSALGIWIVTPFILIWHNSGFRLPRRHWHEALLLIVAFYLVLRFAFDSAETATHLAYVAGATLPLAWWSAYRFGLHGAATASLIIASCTAWHGTHHTGVFADYSAIETTLMAQLYIAFVTWTCYLVALGVASRHPRLLNELLEPHLRKPLPAPEAPTSSPPVWETQLTERVFEANPQAIIVTDANGAIRRVNPSFSRITGYSAEEVLGRNPAILRPQVSDASLFDKVWRELKHDGCWQGELALRRPNGKIYPVWCSLSVVHDLQQRITHFLAVFIDITEEKLTQERIYHLAHYDVLTNLPNRRLLHDHLEQALRQAKRQEQTVALALLDLDQFKIVNDSLGHDVGDNLLEQTARRLTHQLRRSDIVGRWSGDEFAIILPNINALHGACRVADKLLEALRQPFELDGRELFLSASIGLALAPADGETALALLQNADTALHRAKGKGGNDYAFYTEEMNSTVVEHLSLKNQLHKALEQEELVLHYQPQIDIESERIIGFEALLRWQHPSRGLIAPAQFIPLAEQTGQIVPITHWVIKTACQQHAAWRDAGHGEVRMAVNISGRSFRDPSLVEVIANAVHAAKMDAAYLELELTETFLIDNPEQTLQLLKQLKSLGVRIAIDDFGIGYSSLNYLKQFTVDGLKVDKIFVMGLPHDGSDSNIVRAIIAMGKSLQLRVTAEGVETLEQLAFLREEGCDAFQGYYFSRPIDAEASTSLLAQR
ncbi:hypothetical protein CAI21_17620 [Alkalilimnicola ehrlichii]|uniref:cyclic-guanylate-specific phosphodiesterase n=1 Tax=Alkalilimnicola ehrlichii TaxID=351052 RepID=A0A3E0WHH6_9GAMM|nr:EAL domain-containing protein [Alkalilimnicola ehrlichii]RFA26150.1 hypothetical protein CAI21_17620 [Alkalilimnicola ehrlichii]RFA32354.1 hypothetical protein CAL65_19920 [Alkalilimnicola ehrlichii]